MEIKIRRMIREDREDIKSILLRCDVFNQMEINCALELIDIYLNNLHQKDYFIASALNDNEEILGYACYGKSPLTDSVYDRGNKIVLLVEVIKVYIYQFK